MPKLEKLAEIYGTDVMTMLEEATFDSIAPAICMNCDYTEDMEPDQDQGWCPECEQNSMKSCLILAGVI